jgi:hypothetical protein
MTRPRLLPLLFVLTSCATLDHGTTQVIRIQPDPADAVCTVTQGHSGTPLTPVDGKVKLPRSGLNLTVVCTKLGYRAAEVFKVPMNDQRLAGLSYMVDVASGANYSYPPVVKVPLTPIQP